MNKQAQLIREISGVNPLKCMKCGKCSASCPSYNEMDIKPHQFVSYVLDNYDPKKIIIYCKVLHMLELQVLYMQIHPDLFRS